MSQGRKEHVVELTHKNWFKLTLSTGVVLGVGAWIASKTQIQAGEVWHSIQRLGWKTAVAAFFLNALQLAFLTARYGCLIPRECHPGWRRVLYAIGVGHSVNTFFPARAGDLLKCLLIARGKRRKISLLTSAGVLFADRIVDLATLAGMAILWQAYRNPKLAEWTKGKSFYEVWVVLGLVIIGGAVWYFTQRRRKKLAKWGRDFRLGLSCLVRPGWLSLSVLCAFAAWSAEGWSIGLLAETQGVSLSFANLVFVIVALNVAISVPFSFANIGPFEAAIALGLSTFGMSSSEALAVATVHHAIALLAVLTWLGLSLLLRPRS